MKILNTIKIAACSLLVTGCGSAPKHANVLREVIPPKHVTEMVNSIATSSKKGLDNTYKMFGRDTIYVGHVDKFDKKDIIKKLDSRANNASVIKTIGYQYQKSCDCYELLKHRIFNKTKAVVNSDKVFGDKNSNLYLPVEYFGKN